MISRRASLLIFVVLAAFTAGWLLRGVAGPGVHQPHAAAPITGEGEVLCTRVIDGDTVEVLGGERVRYIGIDTPEMRPVEAWAEAATAANRELVEQRMVRLEPDVQARDRYGRVLAYVWVDGLMVNEELVWLGLAQVSTYPPNVRYQERLLTAERAARGAERGLWARDGGGPAPGG